MRFSLVSLALASVVRACNANANATDYTTIKTKTGVYTGLIDPKYPQTKQFRSIAFAEPPIQARRWLPPQKLPHSTKHHNATSLPPSCPQFISSIPSLLSTYFANGAMINTGTQNSTSGLVGATTSEDCLYLSIWTPLSATPTSNLPVLVFLPGGGFTTGGIDSGYYDPAAWIERSQSHIVVTINYRLNIFAFPNAPGLEEQNLGILDQRMALEWNPYHGPEELGWNALDARGARTDSATELQRTSVTRLRSQNATTDDAVNSPSSPANWTVANDLPTMAVKQGAQKFVKYTLEPQGVWSKVKNFLAIDAGRSSGVPMNATFRNPTPAAYDPKGYDDPVTVPAADIAENPYWKRDVRRRYPQLSTVTQADAVALLEVGSAAAPKQELIGEAGSKQLVAAQEEGIKGLAVAFEKNTGLAKDVLGPGGLPPLPSGMGSSPLGEKRYEIDTTHGFPEQYPCRQFQ
ncbi:hypothetical protein GRF29_8g3415928 [Pseudopithomyces chartarum]|uniref:Carboxylesterase type B domain-containing protein n=1 Tax=Pseudopithomyces chartarum TaxID=1892770 RepID=A0AAN6RME7_9PLEO|nr:hypothetical protein GRF29_8g3415928 [Pseudopithomyces chartarum]